MEEKNKDNLPITEEWLKENGWKGETLFYQVGGGEDEDDCSIWVKDEMALTHSSIHKLWYIAKRSDLNYINGFPYDDYIRYTHEILN